MQFCKLSLSVRVLLLSHLVFLHHMVDTEDQLWQEGRQRVLWDAVNGGL